MEDQGPGPGPRLDGADIVFFATEAAFEDWLEEHHSRQEGVWIKVAKKKSGIESITDDELVDAGLCFGWISGQRRALDDQYYLQKYLPRRPRSVWSRVNVDKVAELTASGRMREAGLSEVRKAQDDGRWDAAYESQKTASVPAELAAALAADPEASAAFQALDRTRRYQTIILPLLQARTDDALQARLTKALTLLKGTDPGAGS